MILVMFLPMLLWICGHDWIQTEDELVVTNIPRYPKTHASHPHQPLSMHYAHEPDPEEANIEISSFSEYLNSRLPPKPIRITFSTETFNGLKSELLVVTNTFQNVIEFISQMLKTRYSRTRPIKILAKFHPLLREEFINDSDLHIFLQNFNSTSEFFKNKGLEIGTNARSRHIINGSHPDVGVIEIGHGLIPLVPENFNSSNHDFFHVLTHELFHILGFSSSLYPFWLNHSTSEIYGSSLPLTTITERGITHSVLHTPILHKYAISKFGKETYFGSVPAGLILEDYQKRGTFLSHPEATLYLPDFMVGLAAPRQEITDLSLAVLQDTGWYEVNYSLSKFLLYGHGPSMGRGLLSALPDGIPRLVFPPHYQCNLNERLKCSWDRRSIGSCGSAPLNCSGLNNSAQCETSWYTDPNNTGLVSMHQLVSYIFPNMIEGNICQNGDMSGSKFSYYETRGPTSFCYEFVPDTQYSPICLDTTCNDNLRLTLTFQGNRTVLCERENNIVQYDRFKIMCPDPKEIYTMIEFEKIHHPEQGFQYPTIHLSSPISINLYRVIIIIIIIIIGSIGWTSWIGVIGLVSWIGLIGLVGWMGLIDLIGLVGLVGLIGLIRLIGLIVQNISRHISESCRKTNNHLD
jgi:hypothetical protein